LQQRDGYKRAVESENRAGDEQGLERRI